MDLIFYSLIILLALYVAWHLGGNDVANSMGTSVGAKVINLQQALVIAGILEFTGAVLFGQTVASKLATSIVNVELFTPTPQILLRGMVSVLIACGLWLQIATTLGLPVASSHAVIGAIAGFSGVALGLSGIDWQNLGLISLGWIITPLVSGLIAFIFYYFLKKQILDHASDLILLEWIPWLSVLLVSIFGIIVLPVVLGQAWLSFIPLPPQDWAIILIIIGTIVLTINAWQEVEKPIDKTNPQPNIERTLGKFQIVSACFVAFAHGSNDVGNAIAPLAVINYILSHNSVPIGEINLPYWLLLIGGIGIVAGLATEGKKVITTIGENIIPLQPSSGFSAEVATATTILLASRFGFPVSTSHALVGAVVGVGLAAKQREKISFTTLKSVVLAWFLTLPVAAVFSAVSFKLLEIIW